MRYRLELEPTADERGIPIKDLAPVDTLPDIDGNNGEEGSSMETTLLQFVEFTDAELDLLSTHFGDLQATLDVKQLALFLTLTTLEDEDLVERTDETFTIAA